MPKVDSNKSITTVLSHSEVQIELKEDEKKEEGLRSAASSSNRNDIGETSPPQAIAATTTTAAATATVLNGRAKKKKWMYNKVSRGLAVIGFIISFGFCFWYISFSSEQYWESVNNPTTATTYIMTTPLEFPAITICNWNAVVNCDYCNLTLDFATRVNDKLGIVESFETQAETWSAYQNGQLFNCYVFNNRTTESIMNATSVGYAGAISFYFRVPIPPLEVDARFGLQVSFHEIGTVPNVFSETNFAISGVDNFFVLTKLVNNRIRPRGADGLRSVAWNSQLSIIDLANHENDVVVVSVAYSTLNENIITEIASSTMGGLLGQIGGMIGIFLGLDVLKLLRVVLTIPYAIKHRSVLRIWESFN